MRKFRARGKPPSSRITEPGSLTDEQTDGPNTYDVFFHDWQNDPLSRSACSYGRVGGDRAQAALASPIDQTLFFAGEATDGTGNNGTVHRAMASGYRAAKEILESFS